MEVSSLRVFVAVADELHFGRAAGRLHFAQPQVTRTIRKLEDELGVKLFDRTTRNVTLTAAGIALYLPAVEAIAAMERARVAVVSVSSGETGTVRVAFAGASAQTIVARLASTVGSALPSIRLEFISSTYGADALSHLERGDADIAFGRWRELPRGFSGRVVARERLQVAVPRDDELATAQVIEVGTLEGRPLVALPPNSLLVELLHSLCAAEGFEPTIVQTAPDTATVLALVQEGIGSSLTVSSVRERLPAGVSLVDLPRSVEEVMHRAAWRSDESGGAVRRVIALIAAIWDEPGSAVADPESAGAESVLDEPAGH